MVEAAVFKELMSTFPSGVAVVTTAGEDGEPHGLTCSSLCSVSLVPPLLLVCIHNRSGTLAAIRARGAFAINLLAAGSEEVANCFSRGRPDRFVSVPWEPTGRLHLPMLISAAHGVAECELRESHETGDHTIVVGEVGEVTWLTGHRPLLYGMRQYAAWPGAPQDEPESATDEGFQPRYARRIPS